MLASLLAGDVGFHKEPFWDNWGRSLMAGVIAAVAETSPQGRAPFRQGARNPDERRRGLQSRRADRRPRDLNRLSKQNISSFLPITEQTRSGILSTAQSYLKVVNSDSALRSLSKSTISLDSVRKGDPMTIYIVIPPDKLESHGALLRLWVGALMLTVMGRKRRPKRSTLFLLDECAQLGEFGPLRQSMTLLRGYGLQVWPFFQDLSQLQRLYPKDWRTIFNNAGVFQLFGVANHLMAKESSDLIGDIDADLLRNMAKDRQIIAVSNEKAMSARLPDYLIDAPFQGQWDPNPMFDTDAPGSSKRGRRGGSRPSQDRRRSPAGRRTRAADRGSQRCITPSVALRATAPPSRGSGNLICSQRALAAQDAEAERAAGTSSGRHRIALWRASSSLKACSRRSLSASSAPASTKALASPASWRARRASISMRPGWLVSSTSASMSRTRAKVARKSATMSG